MSLSQGFPNVFGATQKTNSVLHNLDNETKKIYTDVNNLMETTGHAHTGSGTDGAAIPAASIVVTPAGSIAATDVQAALNELDPAQNRVDYKKSADIASATSLDLTTATGNIVHITGSTTIASVVIGAGQGLTVIFDAAPLLTHGATLVCPTAANIQAAAGDRCTIVGDAANVANIVNYQKADGKALSGSSTSVAVPVRQTVLKSVVDTAGLPTFITVGTGLAVNIAATAVPIEIAAAYGTADRKGTISADTTIGSLTANVNNYLYAEVAEDGSCTLGATVLAPVYQWGGTYSTTNLQSTYNIQEMTMKVGNGSASAQAWRVFVGEALCGASTVTSVVNYALMARYDSGDFTWARTTNYLKSHNIGINSPYVSATTMLKVTTAGVGYSLNEYVDMNISSYGDATGLRGFNVFFSNKNTLGITFSSTPAIISREFGGISVDTISNLCRIFAKRMW